MVLATIFKVKTCTGIYAFDINLAKMCAFHFH